MPRSSKSGARSRTGSQQRWSARVTARSNALDLDGGVFTWKDPHRIALSWKRSAQRSDRRKSDPYRSAMSMLTFYINRAGTELSDRQRRVLERAKDELRTAFGKTKDKPARPARRTIRKRTAKSRF
jgi:hypothetical protein